MFSKKRITILSTAVLAATLCASAFAGGYTTESSNAGYTLGLNLATYGGSDYALMFGYVNDYWLADIGAGYENTKPSSGSSSHIFELRGDLGLRHLLMQTLYLTYGALGSYGFRSPANTATRAEPYAVGAFVGLDYQPLTHLLISFKLSPYTFVRSYDKIEHSDVFSDGSIGVSYVFTA
ncbi:MAG: hypothetical protein COY58_01620 [Gammaproteobacteria bacterium CG_4_10_14_0_8_um_filter_38_16]|nr:MAG: hypothetical protein COY58_01620 [Gammaproteobacteria bacterium CG_4_10_14_0_8_um_filter_38_16]PJA03553.1 MAG: hypothetical protein COX72_04865 [Gammaproteobacteria bacterium CG_4_10_14_0_2_um_filter_38_22]PJB11002.1 MAG: hypothetical protein CO120_01900 [Gammaproteobacteria bacterium CG_4_9_14_3_um_filter_38_9]